MKRFLLYAFLFLSLCANVAKEKVFAQTSTDDLKKPLPADANVRTGVLPNGMKYYIRYNKKPEKRAELRLVVDAGSTSENDDQQGLAHLNEHMAFNGTKHFSHN